MENSFYIDDRFFIEPTLNSVTDQATGEATRLEARLMQLLCILTERKQKMVTREELISTIWLDYGGGDDGLTQAISFLRKTLLDNKKQLIQTVPKKGYIFTGTVSYHVNKSETTAERKKPELRFQMGWVIGITAVILVLCVYFVYLNSNTGKDTTKKPTEVPYPANTKQEELLEENETNTITTRSAGDTVYKLVIIADRPPVFYINSQRISENKWEPYMSLINSLKRKLTEKRRSVE